MPNLNPNCVQVYDCGPDRICTGSGDDILLGTTGTDGNGRFCVTSTELLRCRELVFAIDTCSQPPLLGEPYALDCEAPVPVMSTSMLAMLAGLLSIVGLYGMLQLRRARQMK